MQPTNTTFIRVSSYVRRYFYIKYGTPVVLPMGHPMYQLMMRHLVYNPTLERISKQSSNRASMDPAIRSTIHELQVHAQADDSDELMEVAMPDTIIRTGVAKQTNWYYQLDNAGARLFRKEAKSEYWQEMQLFIRQMLHPFGQPGREGVARRGHQRLHDSLRHPDVALRKHGALRTPRTATPGGGD